MSTERHWLWRLCDPNEGNAPGGITDAPHVIDVDGKAWTVATTGKLIVYLPGHHARASEPKDAATAQKLARFFGPKGDSRPADLAALKHWLGSPKWTQACFACKGTSQISPEYVSCEICEGEGVIGADFEPGWLFGIPLNRNYLAQALDMLQGETVQVCTGAKDKPVWVYSAEWRAAVVPMTVTDDLDWPNAPRFGEDLTKGA